MRGASEKTEQETVKAAPEAEPVTGEKVSTENPNEIKPQSTAAPVADAKENTPPAPDAVKNNSTAPKCEQDSEEERILKAWRIETYSLSEK